jgi:hypothetical protein
MIVTALRTGTEGGRFPSVINILCQIDALPCPTQLVSSGPGAEH